MTQSALLQSVARATGDSVRRLRRLGFRLVRTPDLDHLSADLQAGSDSTYTPNLPSGDGDILPRRAASPLASVDSCVKGSLT